MIKILFSLSGLPLVVARHFWGFGGSRGRRGLKKLLLSICGPAGGSGCGCTASLANKRPKLLAFFLIVFTSTYLHAEVLKVGVLITTGQQRSLFSSLTEKFETDNPGVRVELIAKGDKDYKQALEEWLETNDGPDVMNWQGGERLFQYVRQEQIESIDDMWTTEGLADTFSKGAISAVTYQGQVFGVPVSYYQWGFYYRKSLFSQLNIRPPETWDDFLDVCKVMKQAGIYPITIGNKNNWPTAAWFDYLNLRVNGLDFHRELLRGNIPFDDPRVVDVFNTWNTLIENDYFVKKQKQWDWSEAMPFLYHKMAGMTLMGNFFAGQLPKAIKDDFSFFRFPIVNNNIQVYEEAPLDLFMIPSYSKNKMLAKKFLLTVSDVEFQEPFNEVQGMISPNLKSQPSKDYFIRRGAQTLEASAGLSQFFDRDTSADMATVGITIFTEFMQTGNVSATVNKLEQARQRYLVSTVK